MAITSVDISNRALTLVGSQSTITTMAQDSVEARLLNTVYAPLVTWVLGLANWNFARRTAVLVLSKSVANPPTVPWTSAAPSPPWQHEYTLPADFVRALYMTNSALNSDSTAYAGQPQRGVVICDANSTPVLATNQASAVLVYTSNGVAEANWPWFFERLAVTTLAWHIAPDLNPSLVEELGKRFTLMLQIAEENNRKEGLIVDDATPEWIQAIGIPYPQRRDAEPRSATRRPDDNRR